MEPTQVDVVRALLRRRCPGPTMRFVDADWPLIGDTSTTGGVLALWRKKRNPEPQEGRSPRSPRRRPYHRWLAHEPSPADSKSARSRNRRIWSIVQLVGSVHLLRSERRHCYVAVMIRCAEVRE